MTRIDRKPRHRLDPDSRRIAILDAAASAFAEYPYSEVTIASIAAAAAASNALVYRYFANKEDLYAEVVRLAIADLMSRQAAALKSLPAGAPVRDHIAAATEVYLDHIAHHPAAWAMPMRQPGGEPPAAAELRADARRRYVQGLSRLLEPSDRARHGYALWGYFGFIDAACLRWVDKGCPDAERWPLIDAALGALQGALGDWDA
ncbi:TetR/AcrR family transcriptional regulator [Bifidobacterium sp.]|jgi:AcrR family transcriptional regulator|uniref:TetR/AcrR family transcriptional regulator n=1 Tax=Bifidobacterium sp. TaxID=41200 RepID=UPI0025BE54D7|nr:TetR/AcrR family transcriptional regulator [Bifidobacterium sp.]MCH4209479.1 TetR/AcrR family transcriptional regulator [Bifidobacterium sp.]